MSQRFHSFLKRIGDRASQPVAHGLNRLGIHPNAITILGLLVSVVAGILMGRGWTRWAGVVIALAGICDLLDGALARVSNRVTKFGAFLDSTLDRYSEFAIYLGIMVMVSREVVSVGEVPRWLNLVVVFLAVVGSVMVSYTRARAESLIGRCPVGIMQRQDRVLLLFIGSLIGRGGVIAVIWIIAILSHVTAVERILYTYVTAQREMKPGGSHSDESPRPADALPEQRPSDGTETPAAGSADAPTQNPSDDPAKRKQA